jgi:hypothetical protein
VRECGASAGWRESAEDVGSTAEGPGAVGYHLRSKDGVHGFTVAMASLAATGKAYERIQRSLHPATGPGVARAGRRGNDRLTLFISIPGSDKRKPMQRESRNVQKTGEKLRRRNSMKRAKKPKVYQQEFCFGQVENDADDQEFTHMQYEWMKSELIS